MARYLSAGFLAFGIGTSLSAKEQRLIGIDDYFSQASVTECEVSPDGRWIAYGEQRWEPPRESRNTDLWLIDTAGTQRRRLTFESSNDTSPQWSPDSQYIYFTSRRSRVPKKPPYNGKQQVWRIHVPTGQIDPVTRLDNSVASFQLANDGSAIYYLLNQETNDDPWKKLRESHPSLQYGHGKRHTTEVWKLDLESWRAEKLVDAKKYIREFAVAPDQSWIALITTHDDLLITHEGASQIDLFEIGTGQSSTLPDTLWRGPDKNRHGWLECPVWSTDSSHLAFRIAYDGYPTEIFCANARKAKVWQLARPEGVSVAERTMRWNQDSLYYLGETRARTHVYQAERVKDGSPGETVARTQGDIVVFDFSLNDSGLLCVVKADPTSSRDIFLVDRNKNLKRLTNTNPQMAEWKLPQISLVQWEGARGDRVEGILELPPDYDRAQGKLPTIVQIHGGPTAAEPFCFRYWPYGRTLFPSQGYAVFIPNYRGSSGYGDAFMTDLIGQENAIDVEDILTGVDWLINQGIADPDKLGVMGWSNGGFLTNALITQSNRFKAASSGAGVVDQVMQWGLEDTPGHVINFMAGKLPWEDTDLYRKSSPLYRLGNVTTPTLIHVGEKDPRVPAAHAKTLFRGLRRYGKVPTQLIIYPDAGHSPMTYSHRKAKMAWDVAWFERYLLGK